MKQIFYVSICTHVFFLAVLEEGNSAPSEANPFSAKGRRASFLWMFIARVVTHQLQARVLNPRTVVAQQRDVEMHTLRLHRYMVAMQKKPAGLSVCLPVCLSACLYICLSTSTCIST